MTNLIGDRGEIAVQKCLVTPVAGHHGFEPHFLGPKAQLMDFHVALLDSRGIAFGPHFFIQVKTSSARASDRFTTGFGGAWVRRAKFGLTPFYIAGVELDGAKE